MNDYILWVMRDNERYVLLQFKNEVYEDRIQQVQKEFVLKGYMIREVHCNNRQVTIEFYKTDGEKNYRVTTLDESEEEKQ